MKTLAIVVLLALLPLGCSFSYSSESSWKSSKSSSGSSSGGEDEKEAYRDDVRDFTATWAAETGDVAGFEDGLTTVARRHGITDWEADDATFTAIGAGLKRARVRGAELARYEAILARDEPAKVALLRRGYGS
ncbi:MAG: putative lipoprotein [Deltaproteobacteria bacterium]|nr:putative lipoprotein [Deltaproteobacteria bacterium]